MFCFSSVRRLPERSGLRTRHTTTVIHIEFWIRTYVGCMMWIQLCIVVVIDFQAARRSQHSVVIFPPRELEEKISLSDCGTSGKAAPTARWLNTEEAIKRCIFPGSE